MSDHIIKARGMGGVSSADVANLWICMGNSNQQGKKLLQTIEWLNPRFAAVNIEVADTLNRHHLIANGESEEDARSQSLAMGDKWIQAQREALQKLTIAYTIVRWDDILYRPGIDCAQDEINSLFNQDKEFHRSVSDDVAEYYGRRNIRPNANQMAASEKYVLEEIAVDWALSKAGKVVCVYAGSQLKAMRYLKKKPRGARRISLANVHFVQLKFHANDNRVQ